MDNPPPGSHRSYFTFTHLLGWIVALFVLCLVADLGWRHGGIVGLILGFLIGLPLSRLVGGLFIVMIVEIGFLLARKFDPDWYEEYVNSHTRADTISEGAGKTAGSESDGESREGSS